MGIKEFERLHTNQRLLLEELASRGIQVDVLVPELELVEARMGDHVELILDRDGSRTPYSACVICSDKYLTKRLLKRAGISVPEGEQFFPDQLDDALNYAATLRFPLVVKPSQGSHGEGCWTDLMSIDEVKTAADRSVADLGPRRAFLIEEQRPGMEFRVFITEKGDYAVLHRDPASVIGDGGSTIEQLAQKETARRMNPRTNCLCPILTDDTVKAFLRSSGLTLQSVPPTGAKVYLRRNSNIAHGGNCEDFTEQAHPSVIEIARNALRSIRGLPMAGVDILSIDIGSPQTEFTYCVLEVNSNPGIHMHARPAKGKPRNVASHVADILFPETRRKGVVR